MDHERDLRYDNTEQPTPAQRSRAVRSVAHHAHDAAELRELLDMLGLSPEEGLTQTRQFV